MLRFYFAGVYDPDRTRESAVTMFRLYDDAQRRISACKYYSSKFLLYAGKAFFFVNGGTSCYFQRMLTLSIILCCVMTQIW